MKLVKLFFFRWFLSFCAGGIAFMILAELFPPCTISFWMVAYTDKWYSGPGMPDLEQSTIWRIGATPTASLSYRVMYLAGNAQGKMYALQGMRFGDQDQYLRYRDAFALSDQIVNVQIGCTPALEKSRLAAGWLEVMDRGSDEDRERASREFDAHIEALLKGRKTPN